MESRKGEFGGESVGRQLSCGTVAPGSGPSLEMFQDRVGCLVLCRANQTNKIVARGEGRNLHEHNLSRFSDERAPIREENGQRFVGFASY